MPEPEWVDIRVVYAIQLRQLAEHGGEEGVLNAGLVESALARPRNLWAYSDPAPDLARLAASYAYGISSNHAFVDANKRTALVTCITFLRLNGRDLVCSEQERFETFLRLAQGQLSEDELATWIREHVTNLREP